jgi:hypothetical protein
MSARRSTASVLAAIALAGLAGCSTSPYRERPLERPDAPQVIAIVVDPAPPRIAPDGNKVAEGALSGAGVGTLTGLWLALELVAVAPVVMFFPPALGAIVAGGALGGAVLGAAQGSADEQAAAAQRAQSAVTAPIAAPGPTARGVADTITSSTGIRVEFLSDTGLDPQDSAALRALRAKGYGALIHLRGPLIQYASRPGPGFPSRITLLAEGRLVDTATGRVVALRDFVIESEAAPIDDWTANYGALTRTSAEQASRALAERVVETFVLHTPDALGPEAFAVVACGVQPRDPPPARAWAMAPDAAPVKSLLPVLSWEAAPPAGDYQALPPGARDLRYDLRIWRLSNGLPAELVVDRMGLESPVYQVETALLPATEYGWSVRLRYSIDGHPRALRWSAAEAPRYAPWGVRAGQVHYGVERAGNVQQRACRDEDMTPCRCLDFIPAANLWRFRTP